MRLPWMVQLGIRDGESLAAEDGTGEQPGHPGARMAAEIKGRLVWLERHTARQLHMLARLEHTSGRTGWPVGRDPVHLARQRPRVLKVRTTHFTLYRQKGIPCGPGYQWPTRENRASPCQRQSGGGCL